MNLRWLLLTAVLAVHCWAEDWPEYRGKGRLGEFNETGLLDTFPATGLKVKWRAPLHSGYSGPAVAGGRVFVTDFQTNAARGVKLNENFSDRRASGFEGQERVLALDEKTGKLLWTAHWDADYTGIMETYASGPRFTPTVDGERVYVLGTMGQLRCLNAKTGAVVWQSDFIKDFGLKIPVWGMTSAPIVDGPRLIAIAGGKGDAKVIAFEKTTGKVLWKALSSEFDEPGYAPPFLMQAGGAKQLIVWHPKAVSSLNPETGATHWELPWNATNADLIVGAPVKSANRLFLSCFYVGSFMIDLDETKPAAKMAWKSNSQSEINTDALHSIFSTPVIDGDYIYGVCSYRQFRCLEAKTGKRVWETQDVTKEKARWASAFIVRNGNRYFINNDRGELIIAKLSPAGYQEISRTFLIKPTATLGIGRREKKAVHWSHPAYSNKTLYTRNDEEIIAVSLAKLQ